MHPSPTRHMTGSWLQGAIVGYVCLFRGQTNNILEVIKIQVFVIYFITFLYLYIPARPPAAPTRPLPPADCCESPLLIFFHPGACFGRLRPPGAAACPASEGGREGSLPCPPVVPPPPTRRSLPVDCCLSFFCLFLTQKRGRRQCLVPRRRQPTKFQIRA